MCTDPSTLEKAPKLSLLVVNAKNTVLTSVLCRSERGCVSLLFVFEGLGVLVIFRLCLLRSLDSVEFTYRHNP